MIKIITSLFLILSFAIQAQDKIEMADTMRSEGKIYVVVAIVLVILIGLFLYLFMLDKRLSKSEKNLQG